MSSPDGAAIGVLGSAFNPPHLGHLALAQEALWQLGLDEVILVPTGEAPHKRIADDPGKEARMEMTRLAAAEGDAAETEVRGEAVHVRRRAWRLVATGHQRERQQRQDKRARQPDHSSRPL